MDGYEVNHGLLAEAAKGIEGVIGELKTLGIDEEAEVGRGFGGLSLRGLQVGHAGLEDAFSGFCDRWSWGVRSLVQDGNQFAERLGLSAGIYADTENYMVGLSKDALNTLVGDPHATSQQVENESFSQIMAKDSPDNSPASWRKAGQDAERTWSAEGRDLSDGPLGAAKSIADLTGRGKEFTNAQDQVFGSPPDASPGRPGGNG